MALQQWTSDRLYALLITILSQITIFAIISKSVIECKSNKKISAAESAKVETKAKPAETPAVKPPPPSKPATKPGPAPPSPPLKEETAKEEPEKKDEHEMKDAKEEKHTEKDEEQKGDTESAKKKEKGNGDGSKKEQKIKIAQIKPKKIARNAKEQQIAEGRGTRAKTDYPTMDDVLSDWDSEKDDTKKPKTNEDGQSKQGTVLDDIEDKAPAKGDDATKKDETTKLEDTPKKDDEKKEGKEEKEDRDKDRNKENDKDKDKDRSKGKDKDKDKEKDKGKKPNGGNDEKLDATECSTQVILQLEDEERTPRKLEAVLISRYYKLCS